jgi:hypothetical protein
MDLLPIRRSNTTLTALKNARVEKGHLIIEAHKEKIANKDYNNPALKNTWAQYKANIDTALYTSARMVTEDLAVWQYGWIEARAKLPKGQRHVARHLDAE